VNKIGISIPKGWKDGLKVVTYGHTTIKIKRGEREKGKGIWTVQERMLGKNSPDCILFSAFSLLLQNISVSVPSGDTASDCGWVFPDRKKGQRMREMLHSVMLYRYKKIDVKDFVKLE